MWNPAAVLGAGKLRPFRLISALLNSPVVTTGERGFAHPKTRLKRNMKGNDMTAKPKNPEKLTVAFCRAAACGDPGKMTAAAFRLHRKTLKNLPLLPILMFKKERKDFHPDNCVVAIVDGRVVGCALLNRVPLENLYEKIAARLGEGAARKTHDLCRSFNKEAVYELGSICVDPAFRGRGIGRGFYSMAAQETGGGVFAAIAAFNPASRAAARNAGYEAAPGSLYTIRFGIENGYAVPRRSGEYPVRVTLYRPAAV